MQEIKNVVTWLKNWFYDKTEVYTKSETYAKTEVDTALGNKLNNNLTEANKNLVTNGSGQVILENKPTIPDVSGKIDTAGTGLSKSGTTLNHSNSVTAQSTSVFKKFSYDAQGHITGSDNVSSSDLPSHEHSSTEVSDDNSNYPNIISGLPSSPNSVHDTFLAIDSVIGDLKSIKAIEVVASKPTASASTMGKLYIVNENSKVNVYYTKESGTSPNYTYSWQKMDTDILDELSISWNDITNKPSIPSDLSDLTDSNSVIPTNTSDLVNDGSDGNDTYVETDDLGDVAFSNSYVDLDNIPQSFTPSSHTHGNLSNDGKLTTSVVTNKVVVTDSNNNIGVVTVDELNCGTFAELQDLIDNAPASITGYDLILYKDYKNTGNEPEIDISDKYALRIIGNGHIIDANNTSRIFNINNNNIGMVIQDLCFINAYAHPSYGQSGVYGYGGAIKMENYVTVKNCVFSQNIADNGAGIYCNGSDNIIKDCTFLNAPQTTSTHEGYCIFNAGTSFDIYNCYSYYDMSMRGAFVGVVNKSYLTDHQDISGKVDVGDAVTSIALVPKGNDSSADAYNGVIRLYYGDEPSP